MRARRSCARRRRLCGPRRPPSCLFRPRWQRTTPCIAPIEVGARSVAASGKEDAHARATSLDVETGLPVLFLDYEFLEGPVTVLIGTVKPSGAALAYTYGQGAE